MKISLVVLGALLALGVPARAALEWKNLEADLHPKLTDTTAVAHFKYKNTGDKPVKITAVRPSCGCTTAKLAKDVVAPGESGEIVATFHIGERVGLQTKTIHVATDDQPNEATTLTLKADVPRLLEVKPIFMYWSKKEPVEPRMITATVGGDYPVTKLDVTSTDPDVKLDVEKVPNEKAFHILVTPKTTNRPINAALKIIPNFPKAPPKMFYANIRVDAHPAGAPGAAPRPSASPTASATPAANAP
ncbi:MAG: DUF1573 domain-containing protein [Chthoniobacterales bacterium]